MRLLSLCSCLSLSFLSAVMLKPARPCLIAVAGWLPHIDRFDFAYFKMSRKEALEMDPQQRMAIEVTTEALGDSQVRRNSACHLGSQRL